MLPTEAEKESRAEGLSCSAQEHGFKEIVSLVTSDNDNIIIVCENIPNLWGYIMKYVEVNDIMPGISFNSNAKHKRKRKGDE